RVLVRHALKRGQGVRIGFVDVIGLAQPVLGVFGQRAVGKGCQKILKCLNRAIVLTVLQQLERRLVIGRIAPVGDRQAGLPVRGGRGRSGRRGSGLGGGSRRRGRRRRGATRRPAARFESLQPMIEICVQVALLF